MTSRLRHIAVHAEGPHAGQFVWVLAEQVGATTWAEIQRADVPCATYKDAIGDGLRALQALAVDLDTGPRTRKAAHKPGSGSDADGPGDDPPQDRPVPKKSVFGFGPAR